MTSQRVIFFIVYNYVNINEYDKKLSENEFKLTIGIYEDFLGIIFILLI